MTLVPGHLHEEQRKVLREVALAYRRVMRAPQEPAVTRAEISRRDQKRQSEALAAATAEYRRLSPSARYDQLAVSGEVNRMIAAAINVDPNGSGTAPMRNRRIGVGKFWQGILAHSSTARQNIAGYRRTTRAGMTRRRPADR